MIDRVLEFIKKEKDFLTICQKLELKDYELLGLIELLKRDGHRIELYSENGVEKLNVLSNIILPEENRFEVIEKSKHIRLGVVSDTHLCCKFQQLSLLNKAYRDFHERKIVKVLHIGDMLDGDYRNRPDHLYDLFKIGATDQSDYASEMYPYVKGLITYFLQGSHDASHIKNGGADTGKMISRNRPDMINLGIGKAEFVINKCLIELLHPGGGSAYAYSYRPQKIIDSMRGGEKPKIELIGHYHKNMYMMYRNIHTVLVPSLEATTGFMTANALINDVGYDIIDFMVDSFGNIQRFTIEHIPFYNTIENDYKKAKQLVIK
jgi:hypothetical protein